MVPGSHHHGLCPVSSCISCGHERMRAWIPRRSLMLMALLFCGTLAVYIFHPLKLIEIKADPVVDLSFFPAGSLHKRALGREAGLWRLRIPGLLVSGLMLLAWCFIKLPSGLLSVRTDCRSIYLIQSWPSAYLYFLQQYPDIWRSLSWLRRLITRAAGYTYGVFLIHHLVEAQICAHFDAAMLSRRDTVILLVLCLLAVIIFTALIYRVRDMLRRMFL